MLGARLSYKTTSHGLICRKKIEAIGRLQKCQVEERKFFWIESERETKIFFHCFVSYAHSKLIVLTFANHTVF